MSEAFFLPHRGVIAVSGPDARSFLDTLVSCRLGDLAPDAPRYGALLTPQGKIIAEMFFFAEADGVVLLDVAFEGIDDLLKRLTMYKLRAKVTLEDISAERAVVQTFGACAPSDPRGAHAGARAIVAAADAPAASPEAYHGARIALGLPEQGADYGPETVFASDVDMDLLNGVDYAKGCFVGQEVVSRMRRRGVIRKRTLIASSNAGALAAGSAITVGELAIGEILSSAGAVALALIRVDRLADADPGSITCGGREVALDYPSWFPESARQAAAAE